MKTIQPFRDWEDEVVGGYDEANQPTTDLESRLHDDLTNAREDRHYLIEGIVHMIDSLPLETRRDVLVRLKGLSY